MKRRGQNAVLVNLTERELSRIRDFKYLRDISRNFAINREIQIGGS